VTTVRQRRKTMGRGDKKTEKGKRFRSSFGKSRPKKAKKTTQVKAKVKKDDASA